MQPIQQWRPPPFRHHPLQLPIDNAQRQHLARLHQFLAFQALDRLNLQNVHPLNPHTLLRQKRQIFEERLQGNSRNNPKVWLEYAEMEEERGSIERARWVYQRAVEAIPIPAGKELWERYVELEIQQNCLQRVRGLFERLEVPLLSKHWYGYALLSQSNCHYQQSQQIYQKSLTLFPNDQKLYLAYIAFQLRSKQHSNARNILHRYISKYPHFESYMKLARFQTNLGEWQAARSVFRTLEEEGFGLTQERFWREYARLEIKARDFGRAWGVYMRGLEVMVGEKGDRLYGDFVRMRRGGGVDIDNQQ